jgi:hypothetical protein
MPIAPICTFASENAAHTRYTLKFDNQRQPFARIQLKRKRPVTILRDVSTSELEVLSAILHELQDGWMGVKL